MVPSSLLRDYTRAWFNPSVPVFPQRDRYSCTIHAMEWSLRSLGVTTTVKYMVDQLVAEGLYDPTDWKAFHDKTLRPLADYLNRTFGFIGVEAEAVPGAEWEDIASVAGRWPIVMFGLTWFHSTAVKGLHIPDGHLLLANAADPSRDRPRQTITRLEYAELGPWNAVIVRRRT